MKSCSSCGVAKTLEEFPKDKRIKCGRKPKCRSCDNQYKAEWRKANPGNHRSAHLRSTYGLSLEQFSEMLLKQDHTCLLCDHKHVPNSVRGSLRVDHDHKTGQVRGLLCKECNAGLGLLGDNPARLRRAAEYLETKGHYG